MVEHFVKLHENKLLLIDIPSNKKQKLEVVIKSIKDDGDFLDVFFLINNIDDFSYLTESIIKYYIKLNLETYLKIFSIDKEVNVILI